MFRGKKGNKIAHYFDFFKHKNPRIRKLRKNIRRCEELKHSIASKLREFEYKLNEGRITYSEYEYLKNNYLGNRTEEEWYGYYDDYKARTQKLLRKYDSLSDHVKSDDKPPKEKSPLLVPLLLVLLTLPAFFFITNYTGLFVTEIVEFEYNSSWQNAFVRISSIDFQHDIPVSELLIDDMILVNLGEIGINKSGEVFIDLVAEGEIVDSRKIDMGLSK